ncbi:MAG: hypothetical protein AAGU11_09630 [Syntrophobacteraceae bacterium]
MATATGLSLTSPVVEMRIIVMVALKTINFFSMFFMLELDRWPLVFSQFRGLQDHNSVLRKARKRK